MPSVDVTFNLDNDGILHVSAVEQIKLQANSITVGRVSSRHTLAEIARMVREAEVFWAHDAEKKEIVLARNALDNAVLQLKQKREAHSESWTLSNQQFISRQIADIAQWV